MCGCQAGSEAGGTCADDHNIPVGETVEIDVLIELRDFEIGHSIVS